MKIKLLSAMIAGMVLTGCGSDNSNSVTLPKDKTATIQAFDGAIWGIQGSYNCGEGDKVVGLTTYEGTVTVKDLAFVNAPENCSFTFKADGTVVPQDSSNGKYLPNITLSIPKGLMAEGEEATASPLTTIIAKALGDNVYDETTATEVLTALGLGELLNSGVTVAELLKNTANVVEQLNSESPDLYSQLVATTHVLTDVLSTQEDATVEALTTVTIALTEATLDAHSNYPKSDKGDDIVINLTEELASDTTFDDIAAGESVPDTVLGAINKPDNAVVPPKPEEPTPPTPPTGGTGGTGGGTGGGDGSSGGGTGS